MWKTMELANTADPKDGTTVVEIAADRICETLNALGVRPEHVTIIPTASTRDMAHGDERYRVFYFVEQG